MLSLFQSEANSYTVSFSYCCYVFAKTYNKLTHSPCHKNSFFSAPYYSYYLTMFLFVIYLGVSTPHRTFNFGSWLVILYCVLNAFFVNVLTHVISSSTLICQPNWHLLNNIAITKKYCKNMFACTRNGTLLDSITNKTVLETSKKETSLLEELTTTIKKRDLKLY